MKKKKNIFREAGVLLVVATLVLTALVMVPTTMADLSYELLEESSWPNPPYQVPAVGWTDEHKTIAYYYGWRQNSSSYSGGSSPEAWIPYYYCRANYVFYSYDFSTVGYSDCVLEFKSYINHYHGVGLYSLHVGWSTDTIDWHQVWSIEPDDNYNYDVSVPIPSGQDPLYIGFWVEGDPFYMNYWYIDDVKVIGKKECSEESAIDALNYIWNYIDTSLTVTTPPFKNPAANTKGQLCKTIIDDGIGNNGVIEKINNGDITGAIDKLTNDILPKIDGDPGDWIYDPTDPTLGSYLASWIQQVIDCLETL
jgi:hypothetical protein